MRSNWQLFEVVSRQRGAYLLAVPVAAAAIWMAVVLTILVPAAVFRGAGPGFVVTAIVLQVAASASATANSLARFSRRLIAQDHWPVLAIAGTSSRLAKGLWGPSLVDGLLTFGLLVAPVVYLSCLLAVDPMMLVLMEAAALCWMFVLQSIVLTQTFLTLRGRIAAAIAKNLRWGAPFVVFVFGGRWLASIVFAIGGVPTSLSNAGWFVLGSTLVASLAGLFLVAFARRFQDWTGSSFGHEYDKEKLSQNLLASRKTSRRSKPLRGRFPVFERELRALSRGLNRGVWLVAIVVAALGLAVELTERFGVCDFTRTALERAEFARWTTFVVLHLTGFLIGLSSATGRFDAESKSQTFPSLVLALPVGRFLRQSLAAILLVSLVFHVSAWLVAMSGVFAGSRFDGTVFASTSSALICVATIYLTLVATTTRLAYETWPEQLAFGIFSLVLSPVAVFTIPAILVRACGRLEGEPEAIERGMSRKLKRAE